MYEGIYVYALSSSLLCDKCGIRIFVMYMLDIVWPNLDPNLKIWNITSGSLF